MLNVAVNNLHEAIALVEQLHPAAIINKALCSEYVRGGHESELKHFPHHFSVVGFKSSADSNAFLEFKSSRGKSGDVPSNFLHYIIMRRVEGSPVHYAVQRKWTT